jgi:N utilization substance protein A
MNEIGDQEKIDIVQYDSDLKNYIANALSPAETTSIDINEATKTVTVKLNEDQQKIAIGRGGQNVRLAGELTGYNIDIDAPGKTTKPRATNIEDQLLQDAEA